MKSHRIPCAAGQLLTSDQDDQVGILRAGKSASDVPCFGQAIETFEYPASKSFSSSGSSAASTCSSSSSSSARSSASSFKSPSLAAGSTASNKCQCKQRQVIKTPSGCCCCPCKGMRLKQLESNSCFKYGQVSEHVRCSLADKAVRSAGPAPTTAAGRQDEQSDEQQQQDSIKIVIVNGGAHLSGSTGASSAGQHALNTRRRYPDRLICDHSAHSAGCQLSLSSSESDASGSRKPPKRLPSSEQQQQRCACGALTKVNRLGSSDGGGSSSNSDSWSTSGGRCSALIDSSGHLMQQKESGCRLYVCATSSATATGNPISRSLDRCEHHQPKRATSCGSETGRCNSKEKYTNCAGGRGHSANEKLPLVNCNRANGKLVATKSNDNTASEPNQAGAKDRGRKDAKTTSVEAVRLKLGAILDGQRRSEGDAEYALESARRAKLAAKKTINRSGSQCSSASSTVSSSSSCCSGSLESTSSIASSSSGQITEEEPPTKEDTCSQPDSNNNCNDFPNAYAGETEKTANIPAPPPPLPPPLPSTEGRPEPKWLRQEDLTRQHLKSRDSSAAANKSSAANRRLGHPQVAFTPPQFSAPPEDGTNIKPSEYLKRMLSSSPKSLAGSASSASSPPEPEQPNDSERATADSSEEPSPPLPACSSSGRGPVSCRFEQRAGNHHDRFKSKAAEKPQLNRSQSTSALGGLSDDLEMGGGLSHRAAEDDDAEDEDERVSSAGSTSTTGESKQTDTSTTSSNLMAAIRSFNRSKCLKPATESDKQASAALEQLLAASKRDLIAELKESKGLDGIKRMKESYRSKGELQKLVAAMVPVFKADDFLDEVAENEPDAPLWRRQMLAKKAAEKSRKECEEKLRLEMEERRLSQVPAWKRQMLAKKAAERSRRDDLDKVRRDHEERHLSEMPAWRRQLARLKMTASTGNVNEAGQTML